MPDQIPLPTDQRGLLDRYVAELIGLATGQYAGAIVEILPVQFEDEDAHILVYLPDNLGETDMDRLGDALTERGVEILLDKGRRPLTAALHTPVGSVTRTGALEWIMAAFLQPWRRGQQGRVSAVT